MCGICGYVGPEIPGLLERMNEAIRHRGPDAGGVFHADDVLAGALDALRGLVGTATFHPAAPDSWVTAVDLAEALVERGVPFRDAHHVVGRLVSSLVAEGRSFEDLSATELESFDGRFTAGDIERLDPAWSIANRSSRGGGSLASVEAQIAMLEGLLAAG